MFQSAVLPYNTQAVRLDILEKVLLLVEGLMVDRPRSLTKLVVSSLPAYEVNAE